MTKIIRFCILCIFVFTYNFNHSQAEEKNNSINIAIALGLPHMDPTSNASSSIDNVMFNNVFEGLFTLDKNSNIKKLLTVDYSISKDKLVYNFKIKDNVSFHNGKKLTSHDVNYSFKKAASANSENPRKDDFRKIEKIEIIDEHNLKIILKEPFSEFIQFLAQGDAIIVPKDYTDNKTKPIGTGPYYFFKNTIGHSIELKKFNNYWGKETKIENVKFIIIENDASAVVGLISKKIDAYPIANSDIMKQVKNAEHLKTLTGLTEGEVIVAINNANKPFDKLENRKALSHAIDKDSIISAASFNLGKKIGSHMSTYHKYYFDLNDKVDFNPKKATKIFDKSNIDKKTINLVLPPVSYAKIAGQIIASNLFDMGFKVNIKNVDWATWLSDVYTKKKFDLTVIAHAEPNDIRIYARDNYYFNYKNEKFKNIMKNIYLEHDEKIKKELYKTAQKKIADDYTNVFLFQFPKITIFNKNLSGFRKNSTTQGIILKELSWK